MGKMRERRNDQRGFTLIEVMLVLAILAIIASLTAVAVVRMQRNAYMRAAEAQVKAFKTPLLAYRLDMGDFPATSDALQALRTVPSNAASPTKWNGPYLDSEVPNDPWGNAYRYEYPAKHQTDLPDIWSLGPDGIDGTEDDIGNWVVIKE
jgi:general secretion pathway protein G